MTYIKLKTGYKKYVDNSNSTPKSRNQTIIPLNVTQKFTTFNLFSKVYNLVNEPT